jgi:hypothetical protein
MEYSGDALLSENYQNSKEFCRSRPFRLEEDVAEELLGGVQESA